ncbi:MAG: hypothetical protein V1703_01110 [Candidatus Altiarchaeota archaeon]
MSFAIYIVVVYFAYWAMKPFEKKGSKATATGFLWETHKKDHTTASPGGMVRIVYEYQIKIKKK